MKKALRGIPVTPVQHLAPQQGLHFSEGLATPSLPLPGARLVIRSE